MATTQDRMRQTEGLEQLWKQPAAKPERSQVDSPPRKSYRESRDWSRPLLVAWIAIMVALYVLEPRPSDPGATPLWGTIVLLAFTYALIASTIGLAGRRPWGLGASALAGGLGMVVAVACAATGHHAGAWWIIEAVAFTGLAAGSIAALRARR
jgi:hypothetical protein